MSMEAYILNQDLITVAVDDGFSSFIWTDRFQECGDFEIYAPMDTDLLSIYQKDFYIQCKESDRTMVVEDIKIETNSETGDYLTITGRSLESLLERRIIWTQTIVSGKLQDCIHTLLDENAISPKIEDRKIPNLIFKESTDTTITNLEITSAQYTGDNLYEVICGLCKDAKIGFKIILNESTKQFEFQLIAGTDRTYDQVQNPFVIFSPNYDNLLNSSYINSYKSLKNVALVAGEGEGVERKIAIVGEGSGLSRRELYVDARDISTVTENDVTLTEAEYTDQLKQRGLEHMTEYQETNTFEAEVDTDIMFRYEEHFFMGDKVQFENEYGITKKVFISEFIMSQNENGFSSYPSFTDVDETNTQ